MREWYGTHQGKKELPGQRDWCKMESSMSVRGQDFLHSGPRRDLLLGVMGKWRQRLSKGSWPGDGETDLPASLPILPGSKKRRPRAEKRWSGIP